MVVVVVVVGRHGRVSPHVKMESGYSIFTIRKVKEAITLCDFLAGMTYSNLY